MQATPTAHTTHTTHTTWFKDNTGAINKVECANLETAQDVWGLLFAAGYRMVSAKP